MTALLDAGVSFGIVTVGTTGTLYAIGFEFWYIGPAVGFLVGCVRYFGGVNFAKGLVSIVEKIIKEDNPDPDPGPRPAVQIQATIEGDKRKSWQFADLPGDQEALVEIALMVLSGKTFSERVATRAGLTQDQFNGLRDAFLSRGWAEWVHPTRRQQGVKLSRNGRAILRAIAGHQPDQARP